MIRALEAVLFNKINSHEGTDTQKAIGVYKPIDKLYWLYSSSSKSGKSIGNDRETNSSSNIYWSAPLVNYCLSCEYIANIFDLLQVDWGRPRHQFSIRRKEERKQALSEKNKIKKESYQIKDKLIEISNVLPKWVKFRVFP